MAGALVQSITTTRAASGAYSVDAAVLSTGTFTARAEQSDAEATPATARRSRSRSLALRIRRRRSVTIGYPVAIYNDSAMFSGLTGGVAGDLGLITVRVYPGVNASGTPMMSITTPRMSGNWYTAQSPSLASARIPRAPSRLTAAAISATAKRRRSRSRAPAAAAVAPTSPRPRSRSPRNPPQRATRRRHSPAPRAPRPATPPA